METVYISSLPFRADEEYLRTLFSPFGPVHGVEVHADWVHPTQEPYALVRLEPGRLDEAVEALDGKKIGRTYIRVHRRTA